MKKSSYNSASGVGEQASSQSSASRYSPHSDAVAESCAPSCSAGHGHADEILAALGRLPSGEVIAKLAEVFALLSNPTRLRIVIALRPSGSEEPPELCVCDLAVLTDASESMTSHQLRLLRDAGLVSQRRDGKLVRYRLVPGPIAHLLGDGVSYISR